jgi:DNA repair protein RecO (recombination protein O)
MRFKTEGIVINYFRHRETSIITKIYTAQFGVQNYIVNSVRKAKPLYSLSLFQPFTILDLVVYHKGEGLNRIAEIHCPRPFESITYNVKKSTISLFLAEILSLSLHEEEENPALFEYIIKSIWTFDRMSKGYHNFHLQFLLRLSRFLGFGLESPERLFTESMNSGESGNFEVGDIDKTRELLESDFITEITLSNEERRRILDMIIMYYTIHLGIERDIRSLTVLRSVFE